MKYCLMNRKEKNMTDSEDLLLKRDTDIMGQTLTSTAFLINSIHFQTLDPKGMATKERKGSNSTLAVITFSTLMTCFRTLTMKKVLGDLMMIFSEVKTAFLVVTLEEMGIEMYAASNRLSVRQVSDFYKYF